ncbi:MAG: M56 family metallopeptidase, partial [Oscillospiraceae bacterium]|nr:M56 family metallopeptidase [Oscillospiraceae bacterium]
LLAVKAIFRDKLSPRWQFAAWGVLGVILLLPAGRNGRYVLLEWPFYVEVLRSRLTGEYGVLTRGTAPVPLCPSTLPQTVWDWLFVLYLAGVVFFLVRYGISYIRLRLALDRGCPAGEEQIERVARQYGLPTCRAVKVEGLSSAFVCGLFRPVLALPAGKETDEKVLLHELLHLKYWDVLWGVVICFFRCIHWCNPLLWYCADLAGNDLESLCDQRVLERLEGEERRDYGRILLSMADETYARAPGTTSMANGGKNIYRRIEAIARFKRYPAGMALVSVCVLLVLTTTLVVGAKAEVLPQGTGNVDIDLARARAVPCTTPGGALDTYAKAVLTGRYDYRAMCAPMWEQNQLAEDYRSKPFWCSSSISWKDLISREEGYEIYNLTRVGEKAYEGLLALSLYRPPEGMGEDWSGLVKDTWLMVQTIRAEMEGERWVVVPQEEFRYVQGDQRVYGNLGLPVVEYTAQAGDFVARILWQTTTLVRTGDSNDSTLYFGFVSRNVGTTPRPDGELHVMFYDWAWVDYEGNPADKEQYRNIGMFWAPIKGDMERPTLPAYLGMSGHISGNAGWAERASEEWVENHINLGGRGTGGEWHEDWSLPEAYAADLYVNGERVAELTLLPTEGVIVNDR